MRVILITHGSSNLIEYVGRAVRDIADASLGTAQPSGHQDIMTWAPRGGAPSLPACAERPQKEEGVAQ